MGYTPEWWGATAYPRSVGIPCSWEWHRLSPGPGEVQGVEGKEGGDASTERTMDRVGKGHPIRGRLKRKHYLWGKVWGRDPRVSPEQTVC